MHDFTWTLAFTWGNQYILVCRIITQAELASPFNRLINFIGSFELFEETLLLFTFAFIAADLNDFILDSTQLDYISRFWISI